MHFHLSGNFAQIPCCFRWQGALLSLSINSNGTERNTTCSDLLLPSVSLCLSLSLSLSLSHTQTQKRPAKHLTSSVEQNSKSQISIHIDFLLYISVSIIIAVALFWRSRYSFSHNDFYGLLLVGRLFAGLKILGWTICHIHSWPVFWHANIQLHRN